MAIYCDGASALNLGGRTEYQVTRCTLCCWMKSDGASAGAKFFAKWDDPASFSYLLQISGGNTLLVAIDYGAGGISSTGSTNINNGKWYHVGVTYDGITIRGYVNGVQEMELGGVGSIVVTGTELKIGAGGDGGTNENPYKGWIADARLYNRALSAAEMGAVALAKGHDGIVQGLQLRLLCSDWPGYIPWAATYLTVSAANPVRDNGPLNLGPFSTIVPTPPTGQVWFDSDIISKRKLVDLTTFPPTPPMLNMVLELDAGAGLVVADGLVDEWYSQVPTPGDVRNYVSAVLQPQLGFTGPTPISADPVLNGNPCLLFNGTTDGLTIRPPPFSQSWTIYYVFASPIPAAQVGIFDADIPGGGQTDWQMGVDQIGRINAGIGGAGLQSGGGFADTRPHIVCGQRDQTAGTCALYVDGRFVTGNSGTSTADRTSPEIGVGYTPFSTTGFFGGRIGEILVYNVVHDLNTINLVHRYLGLKYKIQTYRV